MFKQITLKISLSILSLIAFSFLVLSINVNGTKASTQGVSATISKSGKKYVLSISAAKWDWPDARAMRMQKAGFKWVKIKTKKQKKSNYRTIQYKKSTSNRALRNIYLGKKTTIMVYLRRADGGTFAINNIPVYRD